MWERWVIESLCTIWGELDCMLHLLLVEINTNITEEVDRSLPVSVVSESTIFFLEHLNL